MKCRTTPGQVSDAGVSHSQVTIAAPGHTPGHTPGHNPGDTPGHTRVSDSGSVGLTNILRSQAGSPGLDTWLWLLITLSYQ